MAYECKSTCTHANTRMIPLRKHFYNLLKKNLNGKKENTRIPNKE